ncbi:DUF2934 domain-containing protein [Pseudotabrizicola sediminis]|uniref:DUF2934 domain-containing protein n=1 Tax=Pseudotabrizicola sediminis TaxID=2486418 RepID=A0ABY2KS10_9RHOB|nr:DUF2934 domain-containing protein [Pseudotabrizicola sediminis]TGD43935.1 DUF2934 domain-containing protein [Pseudotabrizicola sediminis]
MTAIEEDRIRQRAYEIWEALGCPEGRHEDTWQQAEIEIAAMDAYGLKAVEVRTMQHAAAGTDFVAADPSSAEGADPAPPTLQQLKSCVSDGQSPPGRFPAALRTSTK